MFIDQVKTEPEILTLPFSSKCDQCFDIGYRVHPQGGVVQCPRIQCGDVHQLSDAGKIIDRAIRLQLHRKIHVDQFHFEIARTLAGFNNGVPCSNDELVRRHFDWVNAEHRNAQAPLATPSTDKEAKRREVSRAIRFLREIWLLPVASKKDRPAGYWICVTEDEFKTYFERATREPICMLSTLHRMASANWPLFAEQIEMDFFRDIDMSPVCEFLEQTTNALEFIPEGEPIPYDIGSEGITLE